MLRNFRTGHARGRHSFRYSVEPGGWGHQQVPGSPINRARIIRFAERREFALSSGLAFGREQQPLTRRCRGLGSRPESIGFEEQGVDTRSCGAK